MMVTAFAGAVAQGLSGSPKGLPPRYFYDEAGSGLYERITELDEYYLTRTEAAILAEHADAIVDRIVPFSHLVELGSGSAAKTRFLLRAMRRAAPEAAYHPVDISRSAVDGAVRALTDEFPGLTVTPHVGEYERVLPTVDGAASGRRFVAFLGSSIGNFNRVETRAFLEMLAAFMRPGEPFLIGTDMVKDVGRLERAYDDSQGVTAAFNLNILARINRELGGHFDLSSFRHRAFFNHEKSRIEMHLESRVEQTVAVDSLGQAFEFRKGETIHTENSYKYTPGMVERMAHEGGFDLERSWYDPKRWFGLHLWTRR